MCLKILIDWNKFVFPYNVQISHYTYNESISYNISYYTLYGK